MRARLRRWRAAVELWLTWWQWPPVQAYWYRQYKRADRKAFLAECEEIRARARAAGKDDKPSTSG